MAIDDLEAQKGLIITISIVVFFLTSCSRCIIRDNSGKELMQASKNVIACSCDNIIINGDLSKPLNEYLKDENARAYCAVVINKGKNTGLYQYWSLSSHGTTDNFFIYNGMNVKIVKGDKIEKELSDIGFQEAKIMKAIKKVNRVVKNSSNANSDVF